jgi:NADPH2:quinone reductase
MSAQSMMRAIQIQQTGGPDVLEAVQVSRPHPGVGEVLVKIAVSGVNFIDTYVREGRYPAVLPFIPGQEAAGTVLETGSGVEGFKVSDRVAWTGTRGTYAEYACAPAADLLHVPDHVPLEQAAAVLTQGLTAHYLAFDTYVIQNGDTVLIHAGAGGTGLLLTQIAKRCGARVLTTVSTDAKASLSYEAGADCVILYTQQKFLDAVKKIVPEGLPVVYDSVGKATFEDSLKCLRPRGLMALFGGSSGAVPPFDLIRLSTMGSLYVTRPTLKDYVATRVELERRANELFGWIANDELTVRIGHRYKLENAAQAHRDLEARKTTGKLLLTIAQT